MQITHVQLSFFFRRDPTSVVLVGSDNIILGDSVILSDDSPKTLPVKDLTTNTVRIKLDQKKANKERSPLKKLQEKITRQGQEDSTQEWFKITDISFRTGLLKTLKVCLSVTFSVKKRSEDYLSWIYFRFKKYPKKLLLNSKQAPIICRMVPTGTSDYVPNLTLM